MLVVSYNPLLVGAAVLLALMAAFTGLSLANGLSRLSSRERKPMIVRAAIVLGGGNRRDTLEIGFLNPLNRGNPCASPASFRSCSQFLL